MNTPNQYQILQNSKGDIIISVGYEDSVPTTPRLIYDGGDALLLYRNPSSCVCLRHIDSLAREALQMVDEAIIMEYRNGELARMYTADLSWVNSVSSLIV